MQSKITELGVFLLGIGGLIVALTVYLKFMIYASDLAESNLEFLVKVGLGTTLGVLGFLTIKLRSRPIIITSIAIVILGILIELALIGLAILALGLLGGGSQVATSSFVGVIVRAAFLALIAVAVLRTGLAASEEASTAAP